MAATSTLKDDFQWGDVDTIKWDTSLSTDSTQILSDQLYLYIGHAATSGYNTLQSSTAFDLTGSYIYVHLTDAGNQGLTSHEAIMGIYLDASNSLWFDVSGNNIAAYKKVAGVQAQVGSNIAYNSSTHAWLRISESGGTISWDTSTNGSSWTNRFSVANPFAITAIKPYLQSGCWQNEASGSYADFLDFNLQPGDLQFSWKGYTWNKRIDQGPSMYNNLWSSSNVTGPDGNGYVTMSVTNSGSSPVGGEFYSVTRGWGYGTYITTIGTRVDNMDPEVVMGGMFTFDFTRAPDYAEIDMGEVRRYNGNPNTRILYSHTYNNGSNTFITDDVDVTADIIQTHMATWTPTKIEFTSYVGEGTSGSVINHYIHRTFIPKTSLERVHFDAWVQNLSTPADATPIDIVVRNFTFIPMGNRYVTDYDRSAGGNAAVTSRTAVTSRSAV